MVVAQCQYCRSTYKTHAAWLRKRKRHFCSKKCSYQWFSENVRGKKHHQYKYSIHHKICAMCQKTFDPKRNPNKYCSRRCKGIATNGEKHGRYKQTGHTYQYIHLWLAKNHGSPQLCENFYCQEKSKRYEWAVIRELGYERKRENFWRLCKICHLAYDRPQLKVSKARLFGKLQP